MTARTARTERFPLPAWGPLDLAASLAGEPFTLMDGLTHDERPCALVTWEPGSAAGTVDQAHALAAALALPADAPPLLGAAVGSIDWDGTAQFRVAGNAALFDPEAGWLWVRGNLPAGVVPGAEYVRNRAPWPRPRHGRALAPAHPGWDRAGFCAAVSAAQHRMAAGEIDKVILSVPFTATCALPPIQVYRNLVAGDPPGLRFLLEDGPAGALLGVSPEPLVLLHGRRAEIHLLAGTRPDEAGREDELRTNPKDWMEHSVAVEQSRRDLALVCTEHTVNIDKFMEVERHPGLIHLASHLSGELRGGVTPGELAAACFPAGTVGGVPRAPAIAVIHELEPTAREWYAGAVGAVLPDGGLQLWLTIRSLRLKDGIGHVRTGAGLVLESESEAEWRECLGKARRALAAMGAEVKKDEPGI